jgi:hypothetical protein
MQRGDMESGRQPLAGAAPAPRVNWTQVLCIAFFIALDSSSGLVMQWANAGKSDSSKVTFSTSGELDALQKAAVLDPLNQYYLARFTSDTKVGDIEIREGWRLMASGGLEGAKDLDAIAKCALPCKVTLTHPMTPLPASINLLGKIANLAIGLGLGAKDGNAMECLNPTKCLNALPVAACFAAGKVLSVQAFAYLDAGSFKLLSQVGLPLTALLSAPILGRAYSGAQWEALLLVTLSTAGFSVSKGSDAGGGLSTIGVTYAMSCILIATLGSLFSELFLKRSPGAFYIQKAQLDVGGTAVTLAMAYIMPLLDEQRTHQLSLGLRGSMWDGWDGKVVAVAIIWAAQGWCAGLVAKHLSSVVKKVSQSVSGIVTFSLSLFMLGRSGSVLEWILAFLVMITVHSFSVAPSPEAKPASAGGARSVELSEKK